MKKILALFLALVMIFAFAACSKDPVDDPSNDPSGDTTPPCTSHTDANLDNKCDTCGAAVEATVENTAAVLAGAVKAQLDAAKSFKFTLTFDQVNTEKYWEDVDGTPTEFTETVTSSRKMIYTVSKTETGISARIDMETVLTNGSEDGDPYVETSHAFLIDGVMFVFDEESEKYIKQTFEDAGADALAKIAEGITLTDEEIAALTKSLSENFVTAFDYENRKGSVTVDIKPYFDSYLTVIDGINEDTTKVVDIYNALLATNGGTETVASLLEKAEELLGMTTLEAYDAVEAWLTENHGTTLQALYVSLVTDPRFPIFVENTFKVQGVEDPEAIAEALAEIPALKDKVLRDELNAQLTAAEMTEVTLYEFLVFATADPEATEAPPALADVMSMLEAMLDQTVAEAAESGNPLLMLFEASLAEKADALNAKLEVVFTDAFGISAITFGMNVDVSSSSASMVEGKEDTAQTVSKLTASFTDLSAIAIPIEAPAEEDILLDDSTSGDSIDLPEDEF